MNNLCVTASQSLAAGSAPSSRSQVKPALPGGDAEAASTRSPLWWRCPIAVAVGVAGLVLRIILALAAPRWAFVGDHVANLMWGMAAADHGITHIYGVTNDDLPAVTGTMVSDDGRRITGTVPTEAIGLPNHPPLTIAVYDIQARLLRALVPGAIVNTASTRLLVALTHIPFDILLATAVGLLAATISGAAAGRAAAAFAWLFPPFALNSSFWGQVDTLFLAPVVFTVALILRGRWFVGGAVWGVSLLLKPQAVLLAPVVLLAAFTGLPPTLRSAFHTVIRRLARVGLAAFLVAGLISLPWTLRGGLDWLDRCYLMNIVEAYPLTTLKAFNVWYIDALRLDGAPRVVLDSQERLLGLAKDTWGRLLLLASMAAITTLVWRRYRNAVEGTVVFAALWLWSAFIWPTRVHERYILYAIPFVLVLAACRRRWIPIAVALLVVGSAEHTWSVWTLGVPAGSLVSTEMVAERHRQNVAAHEKSAASAGAAPLPTLAEAELEVSRQVVAHRKEYLQQRSVVWPLELFVTLLSLAAYGATLWLALKPRSRSDSG